MNRRALARLSAVFILTIQSGAALPPDASAQTDG